MYTPQYSRGPSGMEYPESFNGVSEHIMVQVDVEIFLKWACFDVLGY